MIVSREAIIAALWAKASAAIHPVTLLPAFTTVSRKMQLVTDVASADQPALFLTESHPFGRMYAIQKKGLPADWIIRVALFIYDNCSNDPDAIPGQRLNYLIDAVDNALASQDPRGYQTLGGLVSHCWISGSGASDENIELYEGYEGMPEQSVAIVPIEIKVPDASGPV